MVVCIPSGITEVEMRAVKESCERVNGKEVYLIHEPMAAAIGIGIDMQPKGNMIVDIGGTTEIAVIAWLELCDKSVKLLVMFYQYILHAYTIFCWRKYR
jgi:rod shape-determining protein MreB